MTIVSASFYPVFVGESSQKTKKIFIWNMLSHKLFLRCLIGVFCHVCQAAMPLLWKPLWICCWRYAAPTGKRLWTCFAFLQKFQRTRKSEWPRCPRVRLLTYLECRRRRLKLFPSAGKRSAAFHDLPVVCPFYPNTMDRNSGSLFCWLLVVA